MSSLEKCVFCRIGANELPVELVFENDEFVAFRDIKPVAPVHVILISRKHFSTWMDISDPGVLGRALIAVQDVAKILRLEDEGFRTVINYKGDGGQTVYHFHIHILGGRFMSWPPG